MSIECLAVAMALAMATQSPAVASAVHEAAPRTTAEAPGSRTAELRAVRVTGVGHHPAEGITPDSVQALADRALREAAGGTLPARFTFAQLEQVAARLTQAYRDAGFLVAQAVLPVQTIGDGQTLEIRVVEGRLGKIHVEGSQRYRDEVLAASTVGLIGQPLRRQQLDSALLHAQDLPGVSLTWVLRPGEHHGETDIVIVAEDVGRPWGARVGLSNHGTDTTGRYRAEAAFTAYNALGLGDSLSASLGYGLDPADSWQGALSAGIPVPGLPGLSGVAGLARSHVELNSGPFAALGINGPTTLAHAGADWTFVNSPHLRMQASARWIHEESRLDGMGTTLSRHEFDVVEIGLALRHVDRGLRGINLLQLSLRQAVDDGSDPENWLYPAHDSHFLVGRLAASRLQALPANQRLSLRGSAQFTGSALVPMEQFSIGGPQSVRAFPLSGALGDRGVQATVEYQVDAPGFADGRSPFAGRSWSEVLTFNVFYDWGRVSPAGANRRLGIQPVTFEGAGAGVTLRLPGQPGMQLELSVATPTGSTRPYDGDDVRAWARFGMTF